MPSQLTVPEGSVLVEGKGTEFAQSLLAAADAAGVDRGEIHLSPIRRGAVVPQAVAEALASAESAEKPAKAAK